MEKAFRKRSHGSSGEDASRLSPISTAALQTVSTKVQRLYALQKLALVAAGDEAWRSEEKDE